MRTNEEVFKHHAEALGNEDIDEILADYADDAVIVTKDGPTRGKEAIAGLFRGLIAEIPNATWDLRAEVYVDDLMLLEWSVRSDKHTIDDGVDTFVFKNGLITQQTVHLTLTPAG